MRVRIRRNRLDGLLRQAVDNAITRLGASDVYVLKAHVTPSGDLIDLPEEANCAEFTHDDAATIGEWARSARTGRLWPESAPPLPDLPPT